MVVGAHFPADVIVRLDARIVCPCPHDPCISSLNSARPQREPLFFQVTRRAVPFPAWRWPCRCDAWAEVPTRSMVSDRASRRGRLRKATSRMNYQRRRWPMSPAMPWNVPTEEQTHSSANARSWMRGALSSLKGSPAPLGAQEGVQQEVSVCSGAALLQLNSSNRTVASRRQSRLFTRQ